MEQMQLETLMGLIINAGKSTSFTNRIIKR